MQVNRPRVSCEHLAAARGVNSRAGHDASEISANDRQLSTDPSPGVPGWGVDAELLGEAVAMRGQRPLRHRLPLVRHVCPCEQVKVQVSPASTSARRRRGHRSGTHLPALTRTRSPQAGSRGRGRPRGLRGDARSRRCRAACPWHQLGDRVGGEPCHQRLEVVRRPAASARIVPAVAAPRGRRR
jgi:hypothetical protein